MLMLLGQWPNSQEKTQNLNSPMTVSQVLSIGKLALLSLPFSNIQIHRKDMLMPVIKLHEQYSLRNTKMMTMKSKRCLLLTFLHSFLTHNSSGALLSKKGMQFTMRLSKCRNYLEDAEILLKSEAKSLHKFLNGRTDNLKLDRWSL